MKGLRQRSQASTIWCLEIIRIHVILNSGNTTSKLRTCLSAASTRETLLQPSSNVADVSFVGIDVARAPGEPAAVFISVAKPTLQPHAAKRVDKGHRQTLSSGRRSRILCHGPQCVAPESSRVVASSPRGCLARHYGGTWPARSSCSGVQEGERRVARRQNRRRICTTSRVRKLAQLHTASLRGGFAQAQSATLSGGCPV